MGKKRVAKEWIIFLVACVAGVVIGPSVIYVAMGAFGGLPDDITSVGKAYNEWLSREKTWFVLAVGCYFSVTLLRSIIWAVKNASSDD